MYPFGGSGPRPRNRDLNASMATGAAPGSHVGDDGELGERAGEREEEADGACVLVAEDEEAVEDAEEVAGCQHREVQPDAGVGGCVPEAETRWGRRLIA